MWYETSEGTALRLDNVIAVVMEQHEINGWACCAVLTGGVVTIPLTFAEAVEVKQQVQVAQMRYAVVRAERLVG